MGYHRLGLAALIVSAARCAVGNPEQDATDSAQSAAIDQVRAGFDSLTERFAQLETAIASNSAADADTRALAEGIRGELEETALALTGPADDATDNGVLGEVQPGVIVQDGTISVVPTSPSADEVLDNAPSDVSLPDIAQVDLAPLAEDGLEVE